MKKGQLLGKVGNSGNSSEPHLHWHLGSSPSPTHSYGLPIRFEAMMVNGKTVEAPAPVQGDRLVPR